MDMRSAKSLVQLTDHQKKMVVKSLILQGRTIRNRYESEMYNWLAHKIMSMDRTIGLDGQELVMISYSLNKEADRRKSETVAHLYRTVSQHILQVKKEFHNEAYAELAARYLI